MAKVSKDKTNPSRRTEKKSVGGASQLRPPKPGGQGSSGGQGGQSKQPGSGSSKKK